jgi:hypothetical protein
MNAQQIILVSRPKGLPTAANFGIENITLPATEAGEVLLKGLYYSVDPYMRGRMNDSKSYIAPFEIGKALAGGVVAEVLESKTADFKSGDLVVGNFPWSTAFTMPANSLQKIDTSFSPASYYLGVLGMPGITAYIGLLNICKPKAGETVVVSGAAGAVGMVVGQIAKIQGCRVIGIAGSDEKVALLKTEYGFDEAINYKTTPDMKKAIAALCPDAVDIYFDNVGGEISDAVISNINFNARIALCGQISMYNSTEVPMGPRLQPMLLTRSVLMQGFIVFNYQSLFPEAIKQLGQWIQEGKLKFTETITEGFEKLPEALIGLFKGENKGKMIVKA